MLDIRKSVKNEIKNKDHHDYVGDVIVDDDGY